MKHLLTILLLMLSTLLAAAQSNIQDSQVPELPLLLGTVVRLLFWTVVIVVICACLSLAILLYYRKKAHLIKYKESEETPSKKEQDFVDTFDGILEEDVLKNTFKNYKDFEQHEQIRKLYEPSHSTDYLTGFAEATSFFIKNFLAETNTSVTEACYIDAVSKATNEPLSSSEYAAYMVFALMYNHNITSDEFLKIKELMPDEDSRQTVEKILYHPLFIKENIDDATKFIKNTKE